MGIQNPSKMDKIVQNWQPSGRHAYGNHFLNFYSFHSDSTWLDDHFGVLHDPLYASTAAWDPKNPKKWSKSSKIDSFLVAMVTGFIF